METKNSKNNDTVNKSTFADDEPVGLMIFYSKEEAIEYLTDDKD